MKPMPDLMTSDAAEEELRGVVERMGLRAGQDALPTLLAELDRVRHHHLDPPTEVLDRAAAAAHDFVRGSQGLPPVIRRWEDAAYFWRQLAQVVIDAAAGVAVATEEEAATEINGHGDHP
jgi:hypothetical protein